MPKSRAIQVLCLSVALVIGEGASAAIVTLSTADGNGADAYVYGGDPTANFGAADFAQVKTTTDIAFVRMGYFRFDLSSITTTQTSAQLTLTVAEQFFGNNGPKSITIYGHKDGFAGGGGLLGENWDESAIVWNNAPGNDPTTNQVFATLTTYLGTVRLDDAPKAGTRVCLSNQALLNFINADTDNLITFIILVGQEHGQEVGYRFATKEFTPAGGYAGQWAPTLKLSDLAPGTLAASTANGTGADTYVRATDIPLDVGGDDFQRDNFGSETQFRVKAAAVAASMGVSRKGYFRVDLSSLGDFVGDAKLSLYTSSIVSGGPFKNSQPGNFRVKLYGIHADQGLDDWSESTITWANAPANIDTTGADVIGIDETKASLLAEILLPTNPGTLGNPRVISNADSVTPDALLDFVNSPGPDNLLTFIAVMERVEGDPTDGYRFASKEFMPGGGTIGDWASTLNADGTTNGLPVVADAYVRAGTYSTSNFGSETEVRIKPSATPETHRKGYLKFNVSSLSLPLTDVAIWLYHQTTVSNTVGLIHTLNLYVLNDDAAGQGWVEGSGETDVFGPTPPDPITWLNGPGNDVLSPDGMTGDATRAAQVEVPRNYDGNQLLADFANCNSTVPDALINAINRDTDGQITFVVTAENVAAPNNGQTVGWQIATKEDTGTSPTLTMTLGEICNTPVADIDGDGSVNAADAVTFVACINGPGQAWTGDPVDQQYCRCLDQDDDGDVDLADYALFQAAAN